MGMAAYIAISTELPDHGGHSRPVETPPQDGEGTIAPRVPGDVGVVGLLYKGCAKRFPCRNQDSLSKSEDSPLV